MKKLIVGQKWKEYLESRSRSEMKAKARFARHRRQRALRTFGHKRPKHFRREALVAAPKVFSMINNPEAAIEFFAEVRSTAKNRNVYIDLSDVTTMTPDAIIGLLATIHVCNVAGAHTRGNVPGDESAKHMLNNSGFRNYVRSRSLPAEVSLPKGKIKKFERSRETFQNRFDGRLARELVEFATSQLLGTARPHGPSYSLFSEAMLNTWNHASKTVSSEPWWASVYYDAERRRACFTFLDQGVGIFESHTLTTTLKVMRLFGLLDHAQILQRLFKGEIPSSTREPGRGNGIPWMYETCKAGRIKNLVVVANKAFGDAEHDAYRALSLPFQGTLIYWEIEP